MVFGLFSFVPALAVDTLQVYAIRVQFAEESPDNSLTTGTGLFDSDKNKKGDYKLDPVGKRNSVPYWKKHFEFANAYFNKASGGSVVITSKIFPEASSAYKLKKQIIDYNRTSKMKGEKTAEFDEARSRDYLQFVYDAVMAAHKGDDSPFSEPLPKNPNVKRAYMIIHAGASRLVDGGSMGTRGADTPGDFMDVYIEKDYWQYLPDTLEGTAVRKVSDDSSVVEGLVLKGASVDTLRSIMVTSETASQDGLNWGVNGIIVNQIARELGLPNTHDVVKGISRLGYYDMMDFAGYNAGNGFLPSLPAAWERAYMGWTQVKEIRPVAGKPVTVDIAAAGTGKGSEIVKVPLSASEYLLIENRQRSWDKNGEVSVTLGDPDESSDTIVKTVPIDSLNLVFEDSVCTDGKCKKNNKKAQEELAATMKEAKIAALKDVYRVLALCLGEPPTEFTWKYKNNKGEVVTVKSTPKEFYAGLVPENYNPETFIMVMNDPTREYYKVYDIANYRNTIEGINWVYLNLPNDVIKEAVLKSIKANEPLYASCDVGKESDTRSGVCNPDMYDYESLLGISFDMDKKARILTRYSGSSHAMLLMACDTDENDKPVKWQFENSWGPASGVGGYLTFTDKWFDEYMFRIVINKKYLNAKAIEAAKQAPIMLPAWDYMW